MEEGERLGWGGRQTERGAPIPDVPGIEKLGREHNGGAPARAAAQGPGGSHLPLGHWASLQGEGSASTPRLPATRLLVAGSLGWEPCSPRAALGLWSPPENGRQVTTHSMGLAVWLGRTLFPNDIPVTFINKLPCEKLPHPIKSKMHNEHFWNLLGEGLFLLRWAPYLQSQLKP